MYTPKLIIDYLNCYKIKPGVWWKENILPKERNEILRKYHKENKLQYDINILYKYSLVIELEDNIIVCIYKNDNKQIYTFTK